MAAVLDLPQPQLRPMRDNDLDVILAIELEAYPYPWSRGIFGDCLRVGYSCWVMEVGETIVGYGVLTAGAGEAHVLNLCIGAEHRGNGYGARLLRRLIDLARWHEAGSIFLEVRPSNQPAFKLYEKFGFAVVGRRPNYYPAEQGREDALVMVLRLRSGVTAP